MQFLFPTFLFALGALAIPIIIHLFYFRRFKKVYFTNVRFLKEVKEETNSRQKLRNLLVLLMRALALIMLVLAFAQPFIPRDNTVKRGQKAVSLYIDNSFSMNALSKDAPLLEMARKRAKDIVQAYAPSDRFQVLTNDFEGRDQRLISQDEALSRIEEISISPASRALSKVLTRQQQCLATGAADNKTSFVLSDFQTSIADLDKFRDTLLDVQLIPLRAVQENNISIDSAWFENPVQILNQPARLLVKISNRSDETAEEIRLSFNHDGQTKPVGAPKVAARSTHIDTVNFNILHPGWHEAKLSVSDFPVQFDDDYYFSFYVAEKVKILCINGSASNVYINNAFKTVPYFELDNADVRSLNYARFPEYQLIVLNEPGTISSGLAQELKVFAENGGNVLLFPKAMGTAAEYNQLLLSFGAAKMGDYDATPRQASQINLDEFIFNDVFLNKSANLRLPNSQGNYKLAPNSGEPILSYRDGSMMLAKYAQKEGALYVSAVGIDDKSSDLVRNPEIFVPMLFRMAISGSKGSQIAYTIGRDELVEAKHLISSNREIVYKLRQVKDESSKTDAPESAGEEFIPEQRILGSKVLLTPGKQVQHAGWYRLSLRPDSTLASYAFNFDRKESDLRYLDNEQIAAKTSPNFHLLSESAEANFTQVIDEQNQGIVLWRWCLVFALLFLALEVLFLRLWK